MPITNLASAAFPLWNYLEKHGHDAASIYREAKLNYEQVSNPGAPFRMENINRLWWNVTEIVHDPCFGLELAELWHPSNFGALGYAMLASSTLRTSLARLVRYHRIVSNFNFIRMDESKEGLAVTLLHNKEIDYIPARADATLAMIMNICRLNYTANLAPGSVTLTHSKPDCAARYFAYFQSPVFFNADWNRLTLPLDAVDKKLPNDNPQLAEFHDQLIIEYLDQLDEEDIIQKVKAEIIAQLPSGNVTQETVARKIYISTRNMQRRLQKEGTTFNTIQNETRLDLARQFLTDKHDDMTEIAFLLGFSEVSAFSRAFKRWTGVSPSQFRSAA